MSNFVKAIKEMRGLELMKARAEYKGYDIADGRNVGGKYRSFTDAKRNSYQGEWITLDKGKETEQRWRCLINASRLTENFDKKVISIDYESGIHEGSVFWWDRTNKYWMVSLQQHTEEAYFRGIITRADYELDIDGHKYWAVKRGPVENTTEWKTAHQITFNNLNYSLVLQVLKDSRTIKYFSRHQVIKIKLSYLDADTGELIEEEHNWKVVATDKYSEEFIMDVYLDEWNDNPMEDAEVDPTPDAPDITQPHIAGPRLVYGYDTNLSFTIEGLTNGKWTVSSNKVKIDKMNDTSCELSILTGKPMKFILSYIVDNEHKVEQEIVVQSF